MRNDEKLNIIIVYKYIYIFTYIAYFLAQKAAKSIVIDNDNRYDNYFHLNINSYQRS